MPISRSSSLSRSNIRSNASSEALPAYCGTAARICCLGQRHPGREQAMTRLSSRSVFVVPTRAKTYVCRLRPAPFWSFETHVDEVDHEDQGLAGGDRRPARGRRSPGGRDTSWRRPPTFMPTTPWSQPAMTSAGAEGREVERVLAVPRRLSNAGWAPVACHGRRGRRTRSPRPSGSPRRRCTSMRALHALGGHGAGRRRAGQSSTTPSSPTRTTLPGGPSSSLTAIGAPVRLAGMRGGAPRRRRLRDLDGGALPAWFSLSCPGRAQWRPAGCAG